MEFEENKAVSSISEPAAEAGNLSGEKTPNRLNPVGRRLGGRALKDIEGAPDGWLTYTRLASDLGVSSGLVKRVLDQYKDAHQSQIAIYRYKNVNDERLGSPKEHLHPDLISLIKDEIQKSIIGEGYAPDGWLTSHAAAQNIGRSNTLISDKAEELRAEHPELVKEYRSHKGVLRTYYAPEMIEMIKSELVFIDIPDGWITIGDAASALDVDRSVIRRMATAYSKNDQQLIGSFNPRPHGLKTFAISPIVYQNIAQEIDQYDTPPDDWITISTLAETVQSDWGTIKKRIDNNQNTYIEGTGTFRRRGSAPTVYLSPQVAEAIASDLRGVEAIPDGWSTKTGLVDFIGRPKQTIGLAAEKYRPEHPEWFHNYIFRGGEVEFYSPELVEALMNYFINREPAPDGWMSNAEAARYIERAERFTASRADDYRQDHPEWFHNYEGSRHFIVEHYSPELIGLLKDNYGSVEYEPGLWVRKKEAATNLGMSPRLFASIIDGYRNDHPEWFMMLKVDGSGKVLEHVHVEMIEKIKQDRSEIMAVEYAPDGWVTAASMFGPGKYIVVRNIAERYREEYPDWIRKYKNKTGRQVVEHYSPELQSLIRAQIERGEAVKYERDTERADTIDTERRLDEYLEDAAEEFENSDLKDLLNLFGAAAVTDVLYQLHPEYRKLSVPYVRSKLAEYLGDFLTIKGDLSLAGLEKSVAFLSNPSFQENLAEVVKNQCLRALNYFAKNDPEQVSFETVTDLINDIRTQSEKFTTPELAKTLDDVEAYYDLLFENVHKPDYFVDSLNDGRQFPDINQRINVQEIAFKHKMLIADEMGTGKSASAIMAKEIIGAKQALVIAPSNVLPVWEGYLSDAVSDDGRQLGYFKSGQSPRVLIVHNIEDLTGAEQSDYDYIVVSHERLNDEYTTALEAFNYDMLIVDEMHKLKNISDGKRSANLMRLAERIDGDNQYLALLSGTPVPNKISDIALTLKLIYPERFRDTDNKQLVNQILSGDMLDLRGLLVPRMQMKSLAENVAMPHMNEITETVELSEKEREAYELLVEEDELTATEKMAVLRRFTMNPRSLDATPNIDGAKAHLIGNKLNDIFNDKNKVVMFMNGFIDGMMRGEQTIIDDLRLPKDVTVLAIDGEVDKKCRLEIQEKLRGQGKILLMVSGQTADTGVDFSAAEAVVHYNEPWSMYDKQQQTARVYRPGLKNDLPVYTFIAENTIERGIHAYIEEKHRAIEKLLRGVPITEIQRNMLKRAETQYDPSLEVNSHLAQHYLSDDAMMSRIFGGVKELGEAKFNHFLENHAVDYAEAYGRLTGGSRSYQANVSRLSSGLIKKMIDERGQNIAKTNIVDMASGPEMLRRHASAELAGQITSLDINAEHFKNATGKTVVGSFLHSPLASNSVDYLNLSLGFHYTSFAPSRGDYERLEVLKEANRVLRSGGRMTIGMIHSLEMRDMDAFGRVAKQAGMRLVDDYTGDAMGGKNFRTQVITLEKIDDCNKDIKDLILSIGANDLKALRFKKNPARLVSDRRIINHFLLNDERIAVTLNDKDCTILNEEDSLIDSMQRLKHSYETIESIPREEIIRRGFARIFNGKRYILFTRLTTEIGSVAIR